MARRSTEEVGVNMTPMIDIVFQLIIFFVVTTTINKQTFEQQIILAQSPHGPQIEKNDPRTVTIEVDEDGDVYVGHNHLTLSFLTSALRNAVARYGQNTPVLIRGDKRTKHESIRRVLEACGNAGIWKVSFVATKEKAPKRN